MERFSTEGLRSAGRVQAWNEIYSDMLAAADFIPEAEDFSAGLQMCQVGPLDLARLATGRCTIRRTAAHIDDATPRRYSFIIQASGRGLFVHGDSEVVLNRGDFALCDHAQPHSRVLEDNAEMLLIRVPAEMIREYLPDPEQLCGRRLPGNVGMASAAGIWVRSLWRRLEGGLPSDYDTCLAHHLLDLIATPYSMVFGSARALCEEREFAAIRNHVEQRLYDPDFKSGSIADAMRIEPQQVRKAFALFDETASSYLLRRRLAEAARRLRDPRWRGHTIAEIAYCCGFASNACFSRAFRERYEQTPKEYRIAGGSSS